MIDISDGDGARCFAARRSSRYDRASAVKFLKDRFDDALPSLGILFVILLPSACTSIAPIYVSFLLFPRATSSRWPTIPRILFSRLFTMHLAWNASGNLGEGVWNV